MQYNYIHGNMPQQPRAKEYYTYHYNMLLHNVLSAVIYGK